MTAPEVSGATVSKQGHEKRREEHVSGRTGGPGQGSSQAGIGLTGRGPWTWGPVTHPSCLWFGMVWRVGVNWGSAVEKLVLLSVSENDEYGGGY